MNTKEIDTTPTAQTFASALARKYQAALDGLERNTRTIFGYPGPVLIEGEGYDGIWLECGPLEALVYGRVAPRVALASHNIFFHLQREEGYLPCNIRNDRLGSG